MPPPTKLAPVWFRLRRAVEFAFEMWDPWWGPERDIYGVMGRISLWTAWSVAWGIHHDDRVIPGP